MCRKNIEEKMSSNSHVGFASDFENNAEDVISESSSYKPFQCYGQSMLRCAFSSGYQRGVLFDRPMA